MKPGFTDRRMMEPPSDLDRLASILSSDGAGSAESWARSLVWFETMAERNAGDVLVIGEMRDPETMKIALAAGETGHLVLSTLHTTGVPSTIARITDSFPADRQPPIRRNVAAALSAVFVQTLLPALAGGLVPAAELPVLQYGAHQHIRRNTLHQLRQEITVTRRHGSFTLEDGLAKLVRRGVVDQATAAPRANQPDDFESAMRTGTIA